MFFRKYFRRFLWSIKFWSGFFIVPIILILVMFIGSTIGNKANEQLPKPRFPTEKEIQLGLVHEGQIVEYAKCEGYMLTVSLKNNISNMPPFASPSKSSPQIPSELIEYLEKIFSEKGNFTLQNLLDIPIACITNDNIVHYKLRDYLDVEISVSGITLEAVKEIHPYPIGQEPHPYPLGQEPFPE
jgi:hypothetical protein